MKRILLLVLALLGLAEGVWAEERPRELLTRLQQQVEAMAGYRVDFRIEAGEEYRLEGSYAVQNDDYYMQLAQAEVYGLNGVRYEVDSAKQEVIVDRIDPRSHNILNNPTRAFHFLDEDFEAQLLDEERGVATLQLTPRNAEVGISRITLRLDSATAHPRSLCYEAEGEQIEIIVLDLRQETQPLKRFAEENYPGYEIIDFR